MNNLFLLPIVVLFTGCMQVQMLPYMDQALTLQSMSAEADAQHKYVQNADAQVDKLIAAAKSGDLKTYKTRAQIVKAFGPSLLTKDIFVDGQSLTQELYRHAIAKQAKQKIYLYFDAQGNLTHWEII